MNRVSGHQSEPSRPWVLSFDGPTGLLAYRCLLIVVLVLAPLLWMTRAALFAADVAFLPPVLGSEWIRHPAHDVVKPGEIAQAEFRSEFRIAETGASTVLRARAFGEMEVAVNGTVIAPRDAPTVWKRGASFELRDRLRAGANLVTIRVVNTRGNPALVIEGPAGLRTPGEWTVSSGETASDSVRVVSALFRPDRLGPLQRLPQWRWIEPATMVWLFAWTLVGTVAALRPSGEPIPPTVGGDESGSGAFERWLPAALVGIGLTLNLSNALSYPFDRSTFDWAGHVDYVERIAQTWTLPRATDGWEMYHPPLYYFVAAAVDVLRGHGQSEAGLKAVQILGSVIGSLLPLVAWRQLRALRPADVRGTWIATALVAFLPMSLYINPLISNEAFAGTITAAAVYFALRFLIDGRSSVAAAAAAGAVVGAALLAKVTGIVVLLVGLGCFALQAASSSNPNRWAPPLAYGSVAFTIAGWFYVRNVCLFGDPFITNWDPESGFSFLQEPTFRTTGFFFSFPTIFFQHPTRSIWASFLGGHYATAWADAHSNFFPQSEESAFLAMGIALLLGFAPTVATALGFAATLGAALRSSRNISFLLIVGVVAATWWVMVLLALRAPHYSSIKAFYWISIVPCLAFFFAVGRARISSMSTWVGIFLDVTSLACAALACVLYWL